MAPSIPTPGGDELRELRDQFSSELDPTKKEEILVRALHHVQVRWEQLFASISNEHSPERMLLMLAELDEICESRRAQFDGTKLDRRAATGTHRLRQPSTCGPSRSRYS